MFSRSNFADPPEGGDGQLDQQPLVTKGLGRVLVSDHDVGLGAVLPHEVLTELLDAGRLGRHRARARRRSDDGPEEHG
jgi:hypothetical protein